MTDAPIRDYDGLVAALVARRGRLSRRHEELARFVLNHPEEVALDGVVRLGARAGVPPATITRFAQELGLAGFPDLQRLFRERVLGPRSPYAERLARPEPTPDLDSPSQVFSALTQAAVGSLLRIEESLDRVEMERVVEVLAGAGMIHVAAARGAFGIGAYATFGLAQVGRRARMLDNLGAMRAEQVAAMAPGDALLALTFDDYTPETVEAARLAHGRGHPVLAVTDNELSPVVPLARHALFVKEARLGHFRSQVPALVVVQAIIVSLGRRADPASGFPDREE